METVPNSALLDQVAFNPSMAGIARILQEAMRPLLAIDAPIFHLSGKDGQPLSLRAQNDYAGDTPDLPPPHWKFLGTSAEDWFAAQPGGILQARSGARHELVLPLISPRTREVHGLALLGSEQAPTSEVLAFLCHFIVPLSFAAEREFQQRKLEAGTSHSEELARDPLTGLYNRAFMHEIVTRLFAMYDRGTGPGISIVLIDIDNLAKVNDTLGFQAGDEVLRKTARIIEEKVRGSDIPVYLDGGRFAVFLVGAKPNTVTIIAERMREAIYAIRLTDAIATYQTTASCGVAMRRQQESLDDLLKRTHGALAEAQQAGGNCVQASVEYFPV